MKLKAKEAFLFLSIAIVIIVSFFETQLVVIASSVWVIPFLLLLSMFFLLLASSKQGALRIDSIVPPFLACWLLLCVMFIPAVWNDGILVSSRICFFVIYAMLIVRLNNWLRIFYKLTIFLGFVVVAATFFFYAFPNAYSVMVDFYGYYPPGTGSLEGGYRAGIAAHYSQNGIYISVFAMILFCRFLAAKNKSGGYVNRWYYVVVLMAAIVALLLTGKRGTTVWCFLAVLLTGVVSYKNKAKGIVNIIVLSVAFLAIIQIVAVFVPQLNDIVERFSVMGQDGSSQERIAMWKLAINKFQESPLLGIGFTNYRNAYMESGIWLSQGDLIDPSYKRLDAHNVYLQVLCETGIVGFLIYLAALLLLLTQTIKLVRFFADTDEQNCKMASLFSFCVQVYYLAYSLTGNCLYDLVFCFYGLAIALTMTMLNTKKELIQKGDFGEKNRNSYLS